MSSDSLCHLFAGQRLRAALLCGSMLAAVAAPAFAQSGQVDELVVTGSRVSDATLAIGTDQVTSTVAITQEALLSAPAGITGLKMLESLPGFNVQANDALGLYEFGNSVSIRTFNFQQIGFLIDNIPLGRVDAFGGSPPYRYLDNENTTRVTASSGAGDVSLASYASLGPIVSYLTRAPSEEAGGRLSYTRGSDDLNRLFLRLDTGEHSGFSAFGSASYTKSDLWRGPGFLDRNHYEGKLRYRFANDADITLQVASSKYFDYDSPAITKLQYAGLAGDIFGRKGRTFAYLGYVPSQAVLPPLATAPGVAFSNVNYNQYFKFAVNSRNDTLYGLTLNLPVNEDLSFVATGYYEDKRGYGVSPEAYATSLTNYNAERNIIPGLTAPKGLQYGLSTIDGHRKGINAKGVWTVAFNTISAGLWVEQDKYHRTQQRYNTAGGNPDGAPLLNEPVHLQKNFISTRDSTQFFIKDTLALLDDKLKVDVGFKALDLDYEINGARLASDFINSRRPIIKDNWKDNFLPQVGAVYSVTPREQIFASYSENMALPRGADDIFATASPAAPNPEAERAKNIEVGARTNRGTFNASLVLYKTSFSNRLQSFASPVPGSTTTETFFQNVGAVKAHGAEFSGTWKPDMLGGKVYLHTNVSYNIPKFKENFATFAIKDKRVPDFPTWVYQSGVTWEATPWAIFSLSARGVTQRFTNFVNTERVGGYTVWAAYVDLGGEDLFKGPLAGVKLRANVDNLFDKQYLGTINTTINTPASFRVGPARTIQVTLSADF